MSLKVVDITLRNKQEFGSSNNLFSKVLYLKSLDMNSEVIFRPIFWIDKTYYRPSNVAKRNESFIALR